MKQIIVSCFKFNNTSIAIYHNILDSQFKISIFYQVIDNTCYYLGTVRFSKYDSKIIQDYKIIEDISTEFTLEELVEAYKERMYAN